MTTRGVLVLVATPIGNLGDLAGRAVDELARADVVACEDTRRTGRLLQQVGVRARALMTVNDHTEAASTAEVVRRLEDGQRVAVVTDAGTPGIADPGERLVRAAVAAGHQVMVVPGPSAVVAALACSGLPAGRFVFEGFLARRGRDRAERLARLATEERTVVLYESPHRLARTLADLADAFGPDRPAAVAREMTKLHEEVWRASLGELAERARLEPPRGEIVVVVGGAPPVPTAGDDQIRRALRAELASGLSTRDAAAAVAEHLEVGRRRVYELATRLADPDG